MAEPQFVNKQPHEMTSFAPHFFEQDDPLGGGFKVACGAPGISGQWVVGRDRADAYKNWDDAFKSGKLAE